VKIGMMDYREQKLYILNRDGWKCQYPGCNKPACHLAHRIAQTKANIKKYGKDIIHNELNLVAVCENLAHNSHFNIGFNPVECKRLVEKIKARLAN